MSKCLKCGAELPPVGECPACAAAVAASKPATPAVPSLLDKDIQIDRRQTPERTPAVPGPAVPTFSDLARPAMPPGMIPARPAVAPAQPQARVPSPPQAQPSPMPPQAAQARGAPQPPAMAPPQRLPVPPPMPAAQATPPMAPPQRLPVPSPMPAAQATPSMPPPQRLPVPSPAAATPPQRPPVPAPMPPSQATPAAMPPPQRLPVPPSTQAPPVAQRVPPPSARASAPAPRAASDDPDVTAPGQPSFTAPRPATLAQASAGDPDDTAPGNPPFTATPPADAPSAMATAAQRAELPVPSEAAHAQTLGAEPVTGSRQSPTPVPVMTFSPPANRMVPPPPPGMLSSEAPTPRLPYPTIPAEPSASAQARGRTGAATSPSTGVQEIHARPASLWRRLLSFTVDTAALVGVATLYITLASAITGLKVPSSSQGLTALDSMAAWMHALKAVLLPGAFLLLVLATVYCAIAAFLWNGRTLGRLLLGLRLVDTHGVAPAPTRAILRAMLSVVSFGLFLGGFWMAIFDRRGQTLHDKLTSTFVVQPS